MDKEPADSTLIGSLLGAFKMERTSQLFRLAPLAFDASVIISDIEP